jgi:OOP family OmpA-OmpF porin
MASTKKSIKGFVIAYFLISVMNFSSSAQARIAIVGGINESTVSQTSNEPNFSNIKKGYSPRVGFHIGFLADFPLSPKSKFYFQPSIQFFNKGRKFAQTTKNGTGDTAVYQTNATQFINYIDIPLNLVYKFQLAKKIALIVGLGPYLSFFYNGKTNSTTLGPNNYYSSTGTISNLPNGNGPGQYATFDYGINALAGVDLGGSFITANFSRGLQNAYKDSTYSGTFNNQVFSVTLGVYLGERRKKKTDQIDSTADEDCDGIVDKIDFCPTVPGVKKYNGCPVPDTDCDSVNDDDDKCPTVFGLKRYAGCPIPDTDSDGVNDEEDKCPTVFGLPQYQGCPVDESIAADTMRGDTMVYIIYYDPNKIRINVKGIDKLSKIQRLLKTDPTLNLKISGHSDKNSTAKIAQKQSANRAIIIRNYLKNNDVPASRMRIYYWGSTKAVVPRSNRLEQWKNRRVEIAVYQKPSKAIPVITTDNIDGSSAGNKTVLKHKKKKPVSRNNDQDIANNNSTDINSTAVMTPVVTHAKKKHSPILPNNSVDTTTVATGNATDTVNSGKLTIRVKGKDSFTAPNDQGTNNNDRSNNTTEKNNNTDQNANVVPQKNNQNVAPDNNAAAIANSDSLTIHVKNKNSLTVPNNPGINSTNTSADTAGNKKPYVYKNVVIKNYDQLSGDTSTAGTDTTGNITNRSAVTNIAATATIDTVNSKTNTVKNTAQAPADNSNSTTTNNTITSTSKGKNNTAATITESITPQNSSAIKSSPTPNNTVNTNNADDAENGTKLTIKVKNKNTFAVKNNPRVNNNDNGVDDVNTISATSKSNTSTRTKSTHTVASSTENNSTAGNDITNNKSTPAIKNDRSVNNAVNDEQAAIDSATKDVDMGSTISHKPSAQIDDTDKVLDCYTIYFDPNDATLNSASFDILDHIREILRLDSSLYIGISGYSEKVGSETSAQKISQERAFLARDYMNSYGVTLDRMRVSYWGSKIPVADDNDPYQQWENRRVEVCIYVYPK